MTDRTDAKITEELVNENLNSYDGLIVSIEASEARLSLLIAVCDDTNFRDRIIDRYELELEPEIKSYRIKLDRGEPSLRAALARLIASDDYLQNGGQAVITVTGTEEFYFLKLGEERSEQEIFFGYLQWTREGLRQFPYPIVLWVNNQLKNSIIRKAPDFWSWRKGVFLFTATNKFFLDVDNNGIPITYLQSSKGITPVIAWERDNFHNQEAHTQNNQTSLGLEDLQEIISQAENSNKSNAKNSLVVLYEMVGQIYKEQLKTCEAKDYQPKQVLAIAYFQKAIALRRELNLRNGLDPVLANLGSLYEAQGEYEQAKQLYSEALDILQEQGNYADAIARLNDLAGIHHAQGHYEQAIELYNQALEIYEDGKDTDIATYASTINLLAGTYHAQGRSADAEELYLKALRIRLKEFGEEHPDVAVSKNNLGLLYAELGRIGEAKSNYEEALYIQTKLFGDTNLDVATTLNNLALLNYAQGLFSQAEESLEATLKIRQKLLGKNHPDVAGSLNNLAGIYKAQGRFAEALPLYEQALKIAIISLGEDNPVTQRFRENIDKLTEQLSS
jgi:tetratricopeptide (TPR) repeat protein